MKAKTTFPVVMGDVQFDEFGRYDIAEIVMDEELDIVSGGVTIIGQINVGYCPSTPPTPPTPPKPNRTCGEDGDDDYEQD